MKFVILFAAAAASLGGCASVDAPATEPTPATELIYRTGSNIPIRDRTPLTKEEKEQRAEESKRMLESMQRTGAGVPQK